MMERNETQSESGHHGSNAHQLRTTTAPEVMSVELVSAFAGDRELTEAERALVRRQKSSRVLPSSRTSSTRSLTTTLLPRSPRQSGTGSCRTSTSCRIDSAETWGLLSPHWTISRISPMS